MSSLPTAEIRTEKSVEDYLTARYASKSDKAVSLYGKIVLGIRSDGEKEICKLSDKRKLRSSRLLEDPCMEIHVMRQLIGCEGHVQLIDAVQDERYIVMVIEYIEGGDLYEYVRTSRPHGLGLEQATNLTQQLCRALLRMHDLGFCHLDVSLENILIDPVNNSIKICDYGLSRRFTSATSRRFASNRIRAGKKGYNPPEIAGRRAFDGELVDVWAISVVFWILLTGHPPFGEAVERDVRFERLFNRDCKYLLRLCKLIHLVPERERSILNAVFVDEEDRIGMRELCRLLGCEDDGDEVDGKNDDDDDDAEMLDENSESEEYDDAEENVCVC